MRARSACLAALLLAACAPPPPPPIAASSFGGPVATGSGFGLDMTVARTRREAELDGTRSPGAVLGAGVLGTGQVRAQPLPLGGMPPPATGARPLPGGGLDPSVVAAVAGAVNPIVEPLPAPPLSNAPGISDEQDFDAVAARQSIDSDAERLARLRAGRVQIAPQPLPDRPADEAPNIVGYAVSTTNAVGQPVHRRGGIFGAGRYERACAGYRSADAAQTAFLDRGGPARDRLGLDPDGDGFACGWDPAPFRRAAGRG